MKTIFGKSNIKATVICDSISQMGIRLMTYELEYPRIIHAELLTHGMLCRNSASSRAIPFTKMVTQLNGIPVRFGANVSGMQDSGEHDALVEGRSLGFREEDGILTNPSHVYFPEDAWEQAKQDAIFWSKAFSDAGYHKQVVNRLTEPFQMMKVVLSGTEYDNLFWLRNHTAADPTLEELAKCMEAARDASTPVLLKPGQWHLPYVEWDFSADGNTQVFFEDEPYPVDAKHISLEDAIKMSSARSAAVSFRNEGYTLEKCREVYDRLVGSERKHASAFAHQATPMAEAQYGLDDDNEPNVNHPFYPSTWEPGISHMDRDGQLWSAQFRGWIQNRKLIPGENYIKGK